jgi:hypothetical protein
VVGGGMVAYRQIMEIFEEKKSHETKNGENQ